MHGNGLDTGRSEPKNLSSDPSFRNRAQDWPSHNIISKGSKNTSLCYVKPQPYLLWHVHLGVKVHSGIILGLKVGG